MHDGDIDYAKYTPRELDEAFSGINSRLYPKNYANLLSELTSRKITAEILGAPEQVPMDEPQDLDAAPRYDEQGRYIPNHISPKERLSFFCISLLLAIYGSYGIWVNDLYVPGRRSKGIHLHDVPAWVMYGAILCACIVMLSVIADHYDKRDNEHYYRAFANTGKYIGWSLFGLSLVMAFMSSRA